MTVDIAAIRASIPMGAWHEVLSSDDLLALCDLAERELDRLGVASTHWDGCWKAHDRCAAALYRKGHEA